MTEKKSIFSKILGVLPILIGVIMAIFQVIEWTEEKGYYGSNDNNQNDDYVVDDVYAEEHLNASDYRGAYYYALNSEEQLAYEEILYALSDLESSATITDADYSLYDKEDLKRIVHAVQYEHPEFFWCNFGWSCKKNVSKGSFTISFYVYKYWQYSTEKEEMVNELNEKVDEIAAAANTYATDYEKIKYVHDYLIKTVYYDHTAAENNDNPRTMSEQSEQSTGAYGPLINGAAICCGYAEAFQLVMHRLGIECDSVKGYATDWHAWNAVVIDGDRYMLDVTWDDMGDYCDDAENSVRYKYFLLTTDEISETHTVFDEYPYPECTGTKY